MPDDSPDVGWGPLSFSCNPLILVVEDIFGSPVICDPTDVSGGPGTPPALTNDELCLRCSPTPDGSTIPVTPVGCFYEDEEAFPTTLYVTLSDLESPFAETFQLWTGKSIPGPGADLDIDFCPNFDGVTCSFATTEPGGTLLGLWLFPNGSYPVSLITEGIGYDDFQVQPPADQFSVNCDIAYYAYSTHEIPEGNLEITIVDHPDDPIIECYTMGSKDPGSGCGPATLVNVAFSGSPSFFGYCDLYMLKEDLCPIPKPHPEDIFNLCAEPFGELSVPCDYKAIFVCDQSDGLSWVSPDVLTACDGEPCIGGNSPDPAPGYNDFPSHALVCQLDDPTYPDCNADALISGCDAALVHSSWEVFAISYEFKTYRQIILAIPIDGSPEPEDLCCAAWVYFNSYLVVRESSSRTVYRCGHTELTPEYAETVYDSVPHTTCWTAATPVFLTGPYSGSIAIADYYNTVTPVTTTFTVEITA